MRDRVPSLGRLYEEGHFGQGLQSNFHPLLGQLRRMGMEFSSTFFNPYCCPYLPLLLCYRGGYFLFPSPLESTWATDFNFRQWFAGVIFPSDCFNPFYTILEGLILSSDVPPVISSVLLQNILVH